MPFLTTYTPAAPLTAEPEAVALTRPVCGLTPTRLDPSVRYIRCWPRSVPSGTAPGADHSSAPLTPLYAVTPAAEENSTTPSKAVLSVPRNDGPSSGRTVIVAPVDSGPRSIRRSAVTGPESTNPRADSAM